MVLRNRGVGKIWRKVGHYSAVNVRQFVGQANTRMRLAERQHTTKTNGDTRPPPPHCRRRIASSPQSENAGNLGGHKQCKPYPVVNFSTCLTYLSTSYLPIYRPTYLPTWYISIYRTPDPPTVGRFNRLSSLYLNVVVETQVVVPVPFEKLVRVLGTEVLKLDNHKQTETSKKRRVRKR